jgi:zinc protease
LWVVLWVPGAALAVPKIEHWTLQNGARVYLVSTHELPMVQVRVVFDAGSSRDPPGRRGLAHLTGRMLEEGTGELSADDIAERFEGLGAEFSAAVERDMATVSLRSLTDPALLDPAVELFARILTQPSFPEASLDRERERLRVALRRDTQSPGRVAQKLFWRELYGEHPYAHDPMGDEAGLGAVTRTALLEHHQRYYVGRNAWVVIVGDVKRRQAKRLAERLAGALPAGEPAARLPAAALPDTGRATRVDFAATQTHILMGQPGLRRLDPDYFPLLVGNYTLGGGGLVSRISTEVREKRGLSYSAYSYFQPLRVEGPLVLGLQTKNESRDEALEVLRRVLKVFVANGPTEQELTAAKKHITGAFPLRLDSNRKIADNLAVIGFYNLPLTYLDDFPGNVEAVTAGQVRDAFRRRVRPERMLTVTVGGR